MISTVAIVVGVLIAAKWCAQMTLEWLNQRHVNARANAVPVAFAGTVTPETYAKSVAYTLAKGRFEMIEMTRNAIVLAAVLFSGVLPWFYGIFPKAAAGSAWPQAAFVLTVAIAMGLIDLPFEWYEQFHIEERFGFNTTTAATWWMDRVKGSLLGVALGYPLLVLILKLATWLGAAWWFWAWVCLAVFQLVMMVVAPVLIMPLFNKFTALPAGTLRDGLFALGERAGFRARDIQVMDGSRRSKHSNAFFTGLGRFRKIVLFDTLVEQLDQRELESVLAHEIGHYKKGHIPKSIALSLGGSLLGFYIISVFAKEPWFLGAFGIHAGNLALALLILMIAGGLVTFWLSPIFHLLSRKHEYEADAYAAQLIQESQPLIGALRKLNEKNLSNLTPHPIYSGFYYSHPTLLEREEALTQAAAHLRTSVSPT